MIQWLTKVLGHHGFVKRLNVISCSGYWIVLSFIVKDLLDVENVCAKQEGHIPAGFIFMALFVHSGCPTTFVNFLSFNFFSSYYSTFQSQSYPNMPRITTPTRTTSNQHSSIIVLKTRGLSYHAIIPTWYSSYDCF